MFILLHIFMFVALLMCGFELKRKYKVLTVMREKGVDSLLINSTRFDMAFIGLAVIVEVVIIIGLFALY